MSGKLGGNVWSHNSGGTYARVRNAVTNPNSGRQNVARNALGLAAQFWSLALSQSQRDAWTAYAAQVALRNRIGDNILVSGNNHYLRSNSPRIQAGLPRIDNAPETFDLGTITLPDLVDRVDGANPTIDILFNDLDTWHSAGGALLVFASPSKSQTINFYRGPYQLVGIIDGTDSSPQTVSLRGELTPDQAVFFRFIATTADGRLSQELFARNPASVIVPTLTQMQLLTATTDGDGTDPELTIVFDNAGIDSVDFATFELDGDPGTSLVSNTTTQAVIAFAGHGTSGAGETLTALAGAIGTLPSFQFLGPQSVITGV